MSPDERLAELLLIWQEAHESGRDIPVSQLCAECPELIAVVQQKIAILQRFAGYNQQPRTLVRGSEISIVLPNEHDAIPILDKPPIVPGYELIGVLGRGGMGIVYEARVRAFKEIEQYTQNRTAVGTAPPQEVNVVRMERLKAEADLLKLKAEVEKAVK